jgi:hypothetical protein
MERNSSAPGDERSFRTKYPKSMAKFGHSPFSPLDQTPLHLKPRKAVPHEFVLDGTATLSPRTRSMFGSLAVYVDEKIVLILRDKRDEQTRGSRVQLRQLPIFEVRVLQKQ